jgi:hypothetical protein
MPVASNPQYEVVAPPPVEPSALEQLVECPFCAELVKARAKKCKHCGETLDVALRAAEEAQRNAERARKDARRRGDVNQQVVIHQEYRDRYRPTFPHALHLILTILTFGMWLPAWIIHWIVWELT